MRSSRLPSRRATTTLLGTTALLAALTVAGCGRRGPLEPPGGQAAVSPPSGAGVAADARVRPATRAKVTTTAPATTLTTRGADVVADSPDSPDDDEEEDTTQTVSPIPTPKKRVRAYSVPKEPFILDPLL